ncbi:hypothetical protein VPH35_088688 [Triticum aestivum]
MAPIRRNRRQAQGKEAQSGFEAPSLLGGNAPTGEFGSCPQPDRTVHFPRPKGNGPAGESSSSKHRSPPREEDVEMVAWQQTDRQRRKWSESTAGGEQARAPRRWAARYSTFLMKVTPWHEGGVLLLQPGDNPRLVLKDDRGVTIDARLLRDGESVSFDDTILFPCHRAIVGVALGEGDSRV